MKGSVALMFLLSVLAFDQASPCEPKLWRTDKLPLAYTKVIDMREGRDEADQPSKKKQEELEGIKRELRASADGLMSHPPSPVVTLRSAGVTDINDSELISTRQAFRDVHRFSLLSLGFALMGREEYLHAARDILIAWAETNRPSGNPIDETRLEGFLWGYDLLRCHLNLKDREVIESWLVNMQRAKREWKFGPTTGSNNHKTHHLKMLLMLDKLLDNPKEYQRDLETALEHLKNNLPDADGSSLDYRQRDALHYHVFNLEAWIEIALVTGCCAAEVDRAFGFLKRALLSDEPYREFLKSRAAIDKLRHKGGFSYARPGEIFDEDRAARTIFSYYTLRPEALDPPLWDKAVRSKGLSSVTFYQYRYFLWENR